MGVFLLLGSVPSLIGQVAVTYKSGSNGFAPAKVDAAKGHKPMQRVTLFTSVRW